MCPDQGGSHPRAGQLWLQDSLQECVLKPGHRPTSCYKGVQQPHLRVASAAVTSCPQSVKAATFVYTARGGFREGGGLGGAGAARIARMSRAAVEPGGTGPEDWVRIPTCHLISV